MTHARKIILARLNRDHRGYAVMVTDIHRVGVNGYLVTFTLSPIDDGLSPHARVAYFNANLDLKWDMIAD